MIAWDTSKEVIEYLYGDEEGRWKTIPEQQQRIFSLICKAMGEVKCRK